MIAPVVHKGRRDEDKTPPGKNVYQFRLALQCITPEIWRRIQVPETYSFWGFHVAIQDAMGWMDSHLHMFTIKNPKTGKEVRIELPVEPDFENPDMALVDWDEDIADYFTTTNITAKYEYDFGDGWMHDIEFEGVFPRIPKQRYPKCIAGERACPPEDCGSYPGYAELVEAMKNPKHPNHKEMVDWLSHKYDPEAFKPEHVYFDSPRERREMLEQLGSI